MGNVIIKCFKTPMQNYFYDRFQNSVIAVNEDEYHILKEIEKTKKLPEDISKLKKYIDCGLLQETIIEKIEHPESQDIKLLTEHYMGNLILQVTQQCNMRCEYCVYSGNYYNRKHAASRLNFDKAKKAIDFYLKRSDKADKLVISFYGGEPLLEFELIQQCVAYILMKKGDKPVDFVMTTNGTLLTAEVIRFLVKHDFTLMISLDGDKESHDANRKFKTGAGTFDFILKNLRMLKEYDYDYYKKIMFNCVISYTTDFERIFEFYCKSDLFEPKSVNFNYVNSVGLKDHKYSEISKKNERFIKLAYIKMELSLLQKRKWDGQSLMMRRQLQNIELLYEQLHRHTMEAKSTHHGGPCIPGVRRLFMETSGRFFPCERVSEEDQQMSIGTLDEGLDYEKIDFLLNHGKMIKEKCLSCWNLRICAFCLAEIPKENRDLTKNMLLKQCEKSKNQTCTLLYELCILNELGYRGNDNLQVLK